MPDNADNNGRVTLAVLATKLDYVIAELAEFKVYCARNDDAIRKRDKRIDHVENSVRVITYIGGVAAAVLVAILIAMAKQALGL